MRKTIIIFLLLAGLYVDCNAMRINTLNNVTAFNEIIEEKINLCGTYLYEFMSWLCEMVVFSERRIFKFVKDDQGYMMVELTNRTGTTTKPFGSHSNLQRTLKRSLRTRSITAECCMDSCYAHNLVEYCASCC